MPTIKGIVTQHDLLPAGRNPYYQPPPPSKTISSPVTRKISAPTIIDADTVLLDSNASEWLIVESSGEIQPARSVQDNTGPRKLHGALSFFWRLALKAYANQMTPANIPRLSTGLQINLVA